jgi:PRC-barrel domain protein
MTERTPSDQHGLSSRATACRERPSTTLRASPLGTIKRLIIEKSSGRVAYVVISFGTTDEAAHAVPWGKFQYDVALGADRTDVTERQFQEAPAFARQGEHDWTDPDRSQRRARCLLQRTASAARDLNRPSDLSPCAAPSGERSTSHWWPGER